MKVLITGSKGQLGSELQITAPEKYDITAVDIDQLDITNKKEASIFISKNKFDLIINAAAYTNVDKAEYDETLAYAINTNGVENIADAASKNNARVFHVSTDYVFDGNNSTPYSTEQKREPIGIYGKSKMNGEIALETILPKKHIILRTAWLYSIHGNNFVKTMLKLMNEKSILKIIDDQIGSPTSAKSLAKTLWSFADNKNLYGAFHWTNSGVASWYDFAIAINEEAKKIGLLPEISAKILPISTEEYKSDTKRPAYSVLDKSKTYKDLNLNKVHWKCELRNCLNELNKI